MSISISGVEDDGDDAGGVVEGVDVDDVLFCRCVFLCPLVSPLPSFMSADFDRFG